MYYFYVLQSDKDNGYYYGSTMNLKARIVERDKGAVFATRHRRPLILVYYEAYPQLASARQREQQVKKVAVFGQVFIDE